LDYPFELLLREKTRVPMNWIYLKVWYDLVTGLKRISLAPLLSEDKLMNRLDLKAEWKTGIILLTTILSDS